MTIELLRRERDLMVRELELTRREMELLRNANANAPPQAVIQQPSSHVNINTLKDLMSGFEGNNADFNKWKEQFELVRTTYRRDDDHGRLLISAKLKGKALKWFHSKPELIGMTMAALLAELAAMYDHRQDRLTLRRKFEIRTWKASESFNDYFHEKAILANAVPIDEADQLDYLIDGIPEASLRNQARIQRFLEKKSS